MTDQEINIAVAEIFGRSLDEINKRSDWELAEREFQCGTIGVNEYYRRHLRVDPEPQPIHDYANDLNACHEMEKAIGVLPGCRDVDQSRDIYNHALMEVVWRGESFLQGFKVTSAEARQRCEAFLRVHGKWKD